MSGDSTIGSIGNFIKSAWPFKPAGKKVTITPGDPDNDGQVNAEVCEETGKGPQKCESITLITYTGENKTALAQKTVKNLQKAIDSKDLFENKLEIKDHKISVVKGLGLDYLWPDYKILDLSKEPLTEEEKDQKRGEFVRNIDFIGILPDEKQKQNKEIKSSERDSFLRYWRDLKLQSYHELVKLQISAGEYEKARKTAEDNIFNNQRSVTSPRPLFYDETVFIISDLDRLESILKWEPETSESGIDRLAYNLNHLEELEVGYMSRYSAELLASCNLHRELFLEAPDQCSPEKTEKYYKTATFNENNCYPVFADNFIGLQGLIGQAKNKALSGELEEARVLYEMASLTIDIIKDPWSAASDKIPLEAGERFFEEVSHPKGVFLSFMRRWTLGLFGDLFGPKAGLPVYAYLAWQGRRLRLPFSDQFDPASYHSYESAIAAGKTEIEKRISTRANSPRESLARLIKAGDYYKEAISGMEVVAKKTLFNFYSGSMTRERLKYCEMLANYAEVLAGKYQIEQQLGKKTTATGAEIEKIKNKLEAVFILEEKKQSPSLTAVTGSYLKLLAAYNVVTGKNLEVSNYNKKDRALLFIKAIENPLSWNTDKPLPEKAAAEYLERLDTVETELKGEKYGNTPAAYLPQKISSLKGQIYLRREAQNEEEKKANKDHAYKLFSQITPDYKDLYFPAVIHQNTLINEKKESFTANEKEEANGALDSVIGELENLKSMSYLLATAYQAKAESLMDDHGEEALDLLQRSLAAAPAPGFLRDKNQLLLGMLYANNPDLPNTREKEAALEDIRRLEKTDAFKGDAYFTLNTSLVIAELSTSIAEKTPGPPGQADALFAAAFEYVQNVEAYKDFPFLQLKAALLKASLLARNNAGVDEYLADNRLDKAIEIEKSIKTLGTLLPNLEDPYFYEAAALAQADLLIALSDVLNEGMEKIEALASARELLAVISNATPSLDHKARVMEAAISARTPETLDKSTIEKMIASLDAAITYYQKTDYLGQLAAVTKGELMVIQAEKEEEVKISVSVLNQAITYLKTINTRLLPKELAVKTYILLKDQANLEKSLPALPPDSYLYLQGQLTLAKLYQKNNQPTEAQTALKVVIDQDKHLSLKTEALLTWVDAQIAAEDYLDIIIIEDKNKHVFEIKKDEEKLETIIKVNKEAADIIAKLPKSTYTNQLDLRQQRQALTLAIIKDIKNIIPASIFSKIQDLIPSAGLKKKDQDLLKFDLELKEASIYAAAKTPQYSRISDIFFLPNGDPDAAKIPDSATIEQKADYYYLLSLYYGSKESKESEKPRNGALANFYRNEALKSCLVSSSKYSHKILPFNISNLINPQTSVKVWTYTPTTPVEEDKSSKTSACLIKGDPKASLLPFSLPPDQPALWQQSVGMSGASVNNAWWENHVIIDRQNASLSLKLDGKVDSEACPFYCYNLPYASGEYGTTNEYGYGYYEARFKPAKGAGLVGGSFFVYTGEQGTKSHYEIDIEILGKDTNRAQFTLWIGGRKIKEETVSLGFDAALGFHNYGFSWKKDSIEWFVDGKPAASIQGSFPENKGKIMLNLWAGTGENIEKWLGGTYHGEGATARYEWVKYKPLE